VATPHTKALAPPTAWCASTPTPASTLCWAMALWGVEVRFVSLNKTMAAIYSAERLTTSTEQLIMAWLAWFPRGQKSRLAATDNGSQMATIRLPSLILPISAIWMWAPRWNTPLPSPTAVRSPWT